MHVVVCIKQVPEARSVAICPETGVLMRDGVDSTMNPFDLYALETALRLKEQLGASISVITMGPPQAEAVVREAYQMGADRGYLLSDRAFAGADTLATSYTLARGIEKVGAFDLILCGLQTTDGDTAQVGPGMAEVLKIPHESNVIQVKEVADDRVTVVSDLGTKLYTKAIQFPCLLTVTKEVGEPRLVSYRLKKKTKDWPVVVLTSQDFLGEEHAFFGLSGSPTQVERTFAPETNEDHEIWEGDVHELSSKLHAKLHELRFVGGAPGA
ncbi:MAG: electron transfer flavoprotein subunit beta/FixA family protein [Limnochordia bacterium]|nr:electron transfer flavoprotein subunit beta/FixA family protein [Limnochordia bacterium]